MARRPLAIAAAVAAALLLLLAGAPLAAADCADELAQCSADLDNVTTLYAELADSYDACGCEADPCAAETPTEYDLGMHIGAVFIILGVSLVGAVVPLVFRRLRSDLGDFAVVLGKCAGTGVIIAVALVHMLLPANESLTSECLGGQWHDYGAYAYLFAMLAGLLMQFIDVVLNELITRRVQARAAANVNKSSGLIASTESIPLYNSTGHSHSHGGEGAKAEIHHGHYHPKLDASAVGSTQRVIEAITIEFGVSVHSIFIGLATGVVDDDALRVLLVALAVHQFFEGIALGSRITEANFSWPYEALFTLIFAVSAPLGIAIGVGVYATVNVNGPAFLVVQGTFDAISAGILLYIGFSLLLIDLPADLDKHTRGKPYEHARKAALFASLWLGAGLLAYLGRYL